jgi:hypothetical protein
MIHNVPWRKTCARAGTGARPAAVRSLGRFRAPGADPTMQEATRDANPNGAGIPLHRLGLGSRSL